jgi:hypothetical protein
MAAACSRRHRPNVMHTLHELGREHILGSSTHVSPASEVPAGGECVGEVGSQGKGDDVSQLTGRRGLHRCLGLDGGCRVRSGLCDRRSLFG